MIETQTGNKSTETHRAKLAYVSIRQSARSTHESTLKAPSRQSQLVERAVALGWPAARRCRSSTRAGQEWCPADQRFGCQHL